jgi:hypothetical protein
VPQTGDRITAPDLLVIGLGATGVAALEAARQAGVVATGIDLRPEPSRGAEPQCHYGTRAWGVFGDGTVVCARNDRAFRCHARAVIIATGAIDLPLHITGWHLEGVTGAWRAARDLEDGAEVVVLRGPHAGLGGRRPDLGRFDLTVDHDLTDGSPVTLNGDAAVASVTIGGRTVGARHVLLDNGLQPENTLARMTGLPTVFAAEAGGDVSLPGSIFAARGTLLAVIGDAAGISGDESATLHEARETARLLAESILGGPIPVSIPDSRPAWATGGTPVLPAQATDDTLLCPDEGVTVGMAREAIHRGATTVNDVKRRTRAAMATCQGRDCLWTIRALLAEAGRDHTVPMTARPPVAGITIGELASLGTG